MPVPTDPEKFSIDEMIERLRKRSPDQNIEQGELVTRADGTQAIRLRKRKRRSHQPHKEELRHQRRNRMIQISSAVILLLLVVSSVGIAIIYANSAPFRKNVVRMTSQTSGAHVEIEQFRVNPTRANVGLLTLTWPEGNPLRELAMRGVTAAISPTTFLGKSFTGEEVTANEGILSLGVPQNGQPLRATPSADGPAPASFSRYGVSRLHVKVGDPAQPIIYLRDSEASFQPTNDKGRPLLLLNRGNLTIRGWHQIKLDRSHIEFRSHEMDIVGMRLLHESDNRGFMELSGTVSPTNPGQMSKLAVKVENFLLTGIAGPDMGELISGRIHNVPTVDSNELSFTPATGSAASLNVSFVNSPTHTIELSGFPFLASLARMLEDNWFERPVFEVDATGTLRRNGPVVAFDQLNFEQKGRMILRGNLAMGSDRRLSGQLEVGIAEAMVRSATHSRIDSMAGPAKDGFHWLTLTVSGNVRNPTDNFLDLLDISKKNHESSRSAAPKVPSFEDLTTPD